MMQALASVARRRGRSSRTAGNDVVAAAQQTRTVISVVVLGVVGLVGTLIFAEVEAALPTNHSMTGTVDDITGGFGDALSFLPIIMIVLLAAVVIGVVQRMRG